MDVVLPVLNEAEAIPWVLTRMPAVYAPIVVDNGSTDGSAEIARSLGARVVFEPRQGFGAACYAGLRSATADIVCFMDCDASLDPAALPEVATPVIEGRAGLSLGRRRSRRGAFPVHARVANRVLTLEIKRRTGVGLRDLGPMRVARRSDLLGLDLRDRRSGWPLEMILKAATAGWVIVEIPVDYAPRRGRSKVTGTVAGTFRAVHDMAKVLL